MVLLYSVVLVAKACEKLFVFHILETNFYIFNYCTFCNALYFKYCCQICFTTMHITGFDLEFSLLYLIFYRMSIFSTYLEQKNTDSSLACHFKNIFYLKKHYIETMICHLTCGLWCSRTICVTNFWNIFDKRSKGFLFYQHFTQYLCQLTSNSRKT